MIHDRSVALYQALVADLDAYRPADITGTTNCCYREAYCQPVVVSVTRVHNDDDDDDADLWDDDLGVH